MLYEKSIWKPCVTFVTNSTFILTSLHFSIFHQLLPISYFKKGQKRAIRLKLLGYVICNHHSDFYNFMFCTGT